MSIWIVLSYYREDNSQPVFVALVCNAVVVMLRNEASLFRLVKRDPSYRRDDNLQPVFVALVCNAVVVMPRYEASLSIISVLFINIPLAKAQRQWILLQTIHCSSL